MPSAAQSARCAEGIEKTRSRRALSRGRNARHHADGALPVAARLLDERLRLTPRLPRALQTLRALLGVLAPQGERLFEMRDRQVDACAEIVGDDLRHNLQLRLDVAQRRAHARLLDLRLGSRDEISRLTDPTQ